MVSTQITRLRYIYVEEGQSRVKLPVSLFLFDPLYLHIGKLFVIWPGGTSSLAISLVFGDILGLLLHFRFQYSFTSTTELSQKVLYKHSNNLLGTRLAETVQSYQLESPGHGNMQLDWYLLTSATACRWVHKKKRYFDA